MDAGVIDNPARNRFELAVGGGVAIACYRVQGDRIILHHTEVPPHLRGRGIGSRLAHGVFEALRDSGRTIIPTCSFMASYARRHPEYAGLLAG